MSLQSNFSLGAIEYVIKEVKELDDGYTLGYCSVGIKEIKIADEYNRKKTTEFGKEQTLYHELVHVILDELGRHELSRDEKFVQSFSILLHQFEKTKK